jgi:CheY-like chemotaxis protein
LARTVLLADDSVTAQNMGRRILMDAGYEVITVNNGSAALKKIHESHPDLIVLDVYMPGYGGLEVCQRLKESAETMRIPILLSVGKMEPFKADEAKRVRADGHIVKPFEASELLAALTRLEDRIVHQPELSRARKGKPEKKTRSWHVATDPAQLPEEWSDKIAHLASTKERLVNRDPETAPESVEAVAPVPSSRPQGPPVAVSEAVPEMPVVASIEPTTEDQEIVGSAVVGIEESAAVEESSAAAEEVSSSPGVVPESPGATEAVASSEAGALSQEPVAATESSLPVEVPEPTVTADLETPTPGVEQESSATVTVVEAAAGLEALQSAVAEVASQNLSAAKPRWVAENIALTAEEAALGLEQEMQQAQMEAVSAMRPPDVPAAEATPAPVQERIAESHADEAQETEPAERKGATFAAAASASSSAVASASHESASDDESSPVRDAAAAWQNWQQIRDSVMTPQSASALAESVAQVAKAVAPASALSTTSETDDDPSAASSLESEVLAGIVDSVLAELKPRLMQEIAKKLKK